MSRDKVKILVGERDPFARKQIEQILGQHFQVIFAEDGLELLSAATTFQPDLIILEALLPSKDGFQVCRELKASPTNREIPVIFLTVLRAEERAKQAGADAFLLKPQAPEALLAQIYAFIKKAD